MSDMATEPLAPESTEYGPAPSEQEYAPADERWVVPQREWQQVQSVLGYLSNAVQQSVAEQHAAREAEYREQLQDLLLEDPERYVEARLQSELAPLHQYIAEQQHEASIARGEDEAFEILGELGVPEDEQDSAFEAAKELFQWALAEAGVTNSEDLSAFFQWVGEQWGVSAEEAEEEFPKRALRLVVDNANAERDRTDYYQRGGKASDAMFGNGMRPAGQFTTGDYRNGQSVASRLFGGG